MITDKNSPFDFKIYSGATIITDVKIDQKF